MKTIAEYVHAAGPTNLPTLEAAIFSAIQLVKKDNPGKPLWLVSGKVTSIDTNTNKKDLEKTHENEELLVKIAEIYQQQHPKRIVLTSGHLMSPSLRKTIYESGAEYDEIIAMWENIVTQAVDGVYMASPNGTQWIESKGARRELEAARRNGLRREYQAPRPLDRLDSAISCLPLRRFASTGRVA